MPGNGFVYIPSFTLDIAVLVPNIAHIWKINADETKIEM